MSGLQYGSTTPVVNPLPNPTRSSGNGAAGKQKSRKRTKTALAIVDILGRRLTTINEIASAAGISATYLRAAARLTRAERWAVQSGARPLVLLKRRPSSSTEKLARLVSELGGPDATLDLLIELSAKPASASSSIANSTPTAPPYVDIEIVDVNELLDQMVCQPVV